MTASFPSQQDIFPITTEVPVDGSIRIAGHDLGKLADDFKTPLYVYDATTVRAQIRDIRQTLTDFYPGESSIAYAAKAYFSAKFSSLISREAVELDVVSYAEARLALLHGFNPDRIHLHGNNKSYEELTLAVENDFHSIVVDNFDEIEMVEEVAKALGKRARVWLRITPDIRVRTHPHVETSAKNSKFGFHIVNGDAETAIRRVELQPNLTLTGLHFHLGSLLFDADVYVAAIEELFSLVEKTGIRLEELSPGGGWGIRYTPAAPKNPVENWIAPIANMVVGSCRKRRLPLPRLSLESGRFIVGRAGVSVYTIGTVKEGLDGTLIAAIDGGMADNPRYALYEAAYCATIVENPLGEASDRPIRVVGKYCESGDQLIAATELPRPRFGQRLAIPASGAYHLSMASNYNLAPRPAVLWLEENEPPMLLQYREKPEISSWWLAD